MREDEDGGGGGGEIGCVVGLAVAPGESLALPSANSAAAVRGGRGAGSGSEQKENFFQRIITDIFVGFIGFGTLRLG